MLSVHVAFNTVKTKSSIKCKASLLLHIVDFGVFQSLFYLCISFQTISYNHFLSFEFLFIRFLSFDSFHLNSSLFNSFHSISFFQFISFNFFQQNLFLFNLIFSIHFMLFHSIIHFFPSILSFNSFLSILSFQFLSFISFPSISILLFQHVIRFLSLHKLIADIHFSSVRAEHPAFWVKIRIQRNVFCHSL